MLDFEILAHFLHHFVIQIGAIVSNDFPRESVSTNQFPLYESDHHTPRDIGIGSHFDLFGEIIYRHENEASSTTLSKHSCMLLGFFPSICPNKFIAQIPQVT